MIIGYNRSAASRMWMKQIATHQNLNISLVISATAGPQRTPKAIKIQPSQEENAEIIKIGAARLPPL